MSLPAPTCNERPPIEFKIAGEPREMTAHKLICLRRLGHFRRHTTVYTIRSFGRNGRKTTKITIKWSTKENR